MVKVTKKTTIKKTVKKTVKKVVEPIVEPIVYHLALKVAGKEYNSTGNSFYECLDQIKPPSFVFKGYGTFTLKKGDKSSSKTFPPIMVRRIFTVPIMKARLNQWFNFIK